MRIKIELNEKEFIIQTVINGHFYGFNTGTFYQVEDIPEVATVANWITRYATTLKKLSAQKIEESIKNNLNDPAIIDVIDVNEGEKIGSSSIDIYEKDDSQRLSEESDVHFKAIVLFL
ncbi:4646_t:CDS:2 [Entrophospora sp. SA101]|nr:4646_t:CDS:2 [Entrophospora sp. SA101]